MQTLSIDLAGILFILSYGVIRLGVPLLVILLVGEVLQRLTAPKVSLS